MKKKAGNISSQGENYRWILVLTGFLSMVFCYGIIFNCQGQLIAPISIELGYTRMTLSSIFALIHGGMAISSPLLARLSDRIGPYRTMVMSSAVFSLSILLFSTAKSLPLFYVFALLIGMSVAGITTLILPILINQWFDIENRGFALSLTFTGSGVGGFLLNPLFAQMVGSMGWRWTYVLCGAFFLLAFTPFLLFVLVYLPWKKVYRPLDIVFNEIRSINIPGQKDTSLKYRSVIVSICVASSLISGMGASVVMHGNSHLVSSGQTPSKAAMIIGLFMGLLAFSKLIVGKSCDRLGCQKTLIIFLPFATVGIISLCLCAFSIIGCISFILFFGLGTAAVTVCPPLVVRELFSRERYSKELGKVMASIGLGNIVIPLLGGIIYDKTQNYNTFWIIGSFLLLVAMVLFVQSFRWAKQGIQ